MSRIKDIKEDPSEPSAEETGAEQPNPATHPEFWIDKGKEEVLHTYTEAEMLLLGQELVQAMNTLNAAETNAKSDAADWKGVIKINKAAVDKIKRSMEEGQEVKYVETEIRMHYPKRGWKQVVRTDNREVLREVEMTLDELQLPLYRPDLTPVDTREDVPGFESDSADAGQED